MLRCASNDAASPSSGFSRSGSRHDAIGRVAMIPTSRSSDPSERSRTASLFRSSAGDPFPSVSARARLIRRAASLFRAGLFENPLRASRAS
jgi:hypothetical protein